MSKEAWGKRSNRENSWEECGDQSLRQGRMLSCLAKLRGSLQGVPCKGRGCADPEKCQTLSWNLFFFSSGGGAPASYSFSVLVMLVQERRGTIWRKHW